MEHVTTIGIDLGDKYHYYCALDAAGQIAEEGCLRATRDGLHHFFATLPVARIALEAGTQSAWVSRLLTELGHEVLVGNPRKLRLIWADDRKCDERDARMLARLARFDPELLYPIEHRSAAAQADLGLLKAREVLVAARTKLVGVLHHLWSSGEDYGPFPAPPRRRRGRKSRGPTNVDMASCGQHGARDGHGALKSPC